MIRLYVILSLALLPGLCNAQRLAVYLFNCSTDIHPSEKFVRESIASIDPEAHVSVDNTKLKVRMNGSFDQTNVLIALNNLDHGTFTIDRTGQLRTNGSSHEVSLLPEYFDTGHPIADDTEYQLAKAAWISAHPDQYERLRNGLLPNQVTNTWVE